MKLNKMKRDQLIKNIKELLNDDETLARGSATDIIYMIDDIKVFGGFDYGCRTVDHNILLDDGITWEDILNYGTVVVPETMSYISDDSNDAFDRLGYKRLDLNNNHILGFK